MDSACPYPACPSRDRSSRNHERGRARSNFSAYRSLFAMPPARAPLPAPAPAGGAAAIASENLFYSFDVGLAHVVVYCTEMYFYVNSFDEDAIARQHEWLAADLAAAASPAARAQRPWIIAVGHRPMYCIAKRRHGRLGCGPEAEASRRGTPVCGIPISDPCPGGGRRSRRGGRRWAKVRFNGAHRRLSGRLR